MWRVLLPLLCLSSAATAGGKKWPDLKIRFGLNPLSSRNFASQPRTKTDAEEAGWKQLSNCSNNDHFLGLRYANPRDDSIVLIFDNSTEGYIAGSQSVLKKKITPIIGFNRSAYVLDEWLDKTEAYFTTAYFVDPAVICDGGRTEEQWEEQGTGDRLLIQIGETPDKLYNIPLTRTEMEKKPGWFDHFCFFGMGDHWMQSNYKPDQDCAPQLPLQILYDGDDINGFVWAHSADLGKRWEHPTTRSIRAIIDRPPTCVMDYLKEPGMSSLHHYFYSYPYLTTCSIWCYLFGCT